ncbi:MAG: UTP--glucose-1-phosphate uridylyltransferase [Candidatus Nanopelagicales bacterium]
MAEFGEVRKAVIPTAGLGTRFLPVSKAVPKEMLPVVDRPAIDYVVREAAAAGLDDLLFVQGHGKTAIDDYFDRAPELEAVLASTGRDRDLAEIVEVTRLATIHSVRQGQVLGLGHAIAAAEQHVGHEPFVVLLGDDLIDDRDPLLDRMLSAHRRLGGSVIALTEVAPEDISAYGAVACRPTAENDIVEITDLVEKPRADQAPSNLAVIGRYVLDPVVFDVLRETRPGTGGEIQITDALRTMTTVPRDKGGGVHGIVFHGRRYDTGDKQSYLRAVVALALQHPELGRDFGRWLATALPRPDLPGEQS